VLSGLARRAARFSEAAQPTQAAPVAAQTLVVLRRAAEACAAREERRSGADRGAAPLRALSPR